MFTYSNLNNIIIVISVFYILIYFYRGAVRISEIWEIYFLKSIFLMK